MRLQRGHGLMRNMRELGEDIVDIVPDAVDMDPEEFARGVMRHAAGALRLPRLAIGIAEITAHA
jgi:hypothetical protein